MFLILVVVRPPVSRKTHTAINWIVGFAIGYLVAGRLLGRDDALQSAVLSGTITAVIAWLTYEKPAVLQDDAVEKAA
jgi:uncharacterized membrane protein YkvI